MASTYIILPPTHKVGGVEKRLSGLFLHLLECRQPVRLVVSSVLLKELQATPDLRSLGEEGLDVFDAGDAPFDALRAHVRRRLADAPDGVFHYVLVSPLRIHAARSRRTLYTIPNASLEQYNRRGLVEVYGGILRATRVDILDPLVFRQLTS